MNQFALGKLREWRDNPSLFVQECFEACKPIPTAPPGPSNQQLELFRAYRDNKRITVRSGHGTGKDTSAVQVGLHFSMLYPYSKVVCVAPTAHQLQDILWTEFSKWIRRSVFAEEFVIQRDKIFHKEAPKEWWIRAITAQVNASPEEQAETLAGIHDPNLLWIIDEASGVPDPTFLPIEGSLTQENNKVLLIGNMTKNHGYFYDTHFHPELAKHWKKLHWDSRKSTSISEEWVQGYIDRYGEDSNIFRIRVAGEPPLNDSSTFIQLHWAMQCVGNEVQPVEDDPLYLGVDVGRGGDASVILPRKGLKVFPWDKSNHLDTMLLGDDIINCYNGFRADGLAIDEIGVGASLCDWLSRYSGCNTIGVNVARPASQPERYDSLRDELWDRVRWKCMKGVYSFPDLEVNYANKKVNLGHELANELASVRMAEPTKSGKLKVESKRDMRARNVQSPNIADALCLTEYFHDTAGAIWGKSKGRRRARTERRETSNHSWMCV